MTRESISDDELISAIRESGLALSTQGQYISRLRQLQKGVCAPNIRHALCDTTRSWSWVCERFDTARQRQKLLGAYIWPFNAGIIQHDAHDFWITTNHAMITQDQAERAAVVTTNRANFAALAASESDPEATAMSQDEAQPSEMDESDAENDLPPISMHTPPPPIMQSGGERVYTESELVAILERVLSDTRRYLTIRVSSDREYRQIREACNPLRHATDKLQSEHAHILQGTWPSARVQFQHVRWNYLLGTGQDNSIDFETCRGQILVFGGSKRSAGTRALSVGMLGAIEESEDGWARYLVTRQALDSVKGSLRGLTVPKPSIDISIIRAEAPTRIRLCRELMSAGGENEVNGGRKVKVKNSLRADGDDVRMGVRATAAQYMQWYRNHGVPTCMFDVDASIRALKEACRSACGMSMSDAATALAETVVVFTACVNAVEEISRPTRRSHRKRNKRASAIRHAAVRTLTAMRGTWSDADIKALRHAGPCVAENALKNAFKRRLLSRATQYLRAAWPGTTFHVDNAGLVVELETSEGTRARIEDVPIGDYYTAGLAAHLALCEASAPGYNSNLIVVEDLPSTDCERKCLDMSKMFTARNAGHTIVAACTWTPPDMEIEPSSFDGPCHLPCYKVARAPDQTS